MSSTNFDHFSSNYKELLDRSVALSGEGSEYFAEYKASYIARMVGKDFRGKILDYGCGDGIFLNFLNEQGYARVAGYDAYASQFQDTSVLEDGKSYDPARFRAFLEQWAGALPPGNSAAAIPGSRQLSESLLSIVRSLGVGPLMGLLGECPGDMFPNERRGVI